MDIDKIISKYLLPSVELSLVVPVYTHVKYNTSGPFLSFDVEYALYEASPIINSSKILIRDANSLIVGGRFNYPLREVPIGQLWLGMESDEKALFEKIETKWAHGVGKDKASPLAYFRHRVYEPDYQFKGDTLDFEWKDFIENVVNFKAKKDPRLSIIFKATLLRGFNMQYSPHTIIATNPATGKSSFYEKAGKRFDKISPNQLIGFAKGTDEVHQGSINNQIYTLAIEQIENQLFTNLFSFLLSFMESGKSMVGTGGVEFKVDGTCPIILTANPTGYDVDKTNSFRVLIDKLSDNQMALGRRLGIIVFGTDYKQIEKLGMFDEVEWGKYFMVYRAIEERISKVIQEGVFEDSRFVTWLEGEIPDYNTSLLKTFTITDSDVKDFIESHLEQGHRHLRGAALNCSLVDNMDKLLDFTKIDGFVWLPDELVQDILSDAKEYLKKLVNINLGSLGNICSLLQKNPQMEQEFYNSMPNAMKEVVLMVKAYKVMNQSPSIVVDLNKMDGHLQKQFYQSMEELTKALGQEDVQTYRAITRNHFGFSLKYHNDQYTIEFNDPRREITCK